MDQQFDILAKTFVLLYGRNGRDKTLYVLTWAEVHSVLRFFYLI